MDYSDLALQASRDLTMSDEGIFFRHNDDNTSIFLSTGLDYHLAALEEYFTVPEEVHAESCPACDDIAAGTTFLSEEYPPGWKLVSCQRHAKILNDVINDTRFVGGVRENSRAAATRYYKRRSKQIENKQDSATSASTIAPTSTSTTTESAECSICLEAKPNIKIDCGHTFCSPCITHWAEEQNDPKLADWFDDCPGVLIEYPLLKHHAKSRYTCPMCRYYGQHTKQSRRGKKAWNNISRGLPSVSSSRSRRGGQRRRRVREIERPVEAAVTAETLCAPPSMPVVSRFPSGTLEEQSLRDPRLPHPDLPHEISRAPHRGDP